MHTEHLQNVRPTLIGASWLLAVAVTSLVILALAGLGLTQEGDDESFAAIVWGLLAVASGFAAGGFFAGFRALHAPILHGVAIGIASLVVWFLLNVLLVLFFPDLRWQGLGPAATAGLLLAQMTFAVAGAWAGYRYALRDQPEPAD